MPSAWMRLLVKSTCFNPHPARGPGDARHRHHFVADQVVSIRTRPEGRVMPQSPTNSRPRFPVSIRTRPEGRVMRWP